MNSALDTILTGLGFVELISFEKQGENYRFTESERDLLATVVQIPELDDVLVKLGVSEDDLTAESYPGRVAARAHSAVEEIPPPARICGHAGLLLGIANVHRGPDSERSLNSNIRSFTRF